MGTILTRNWLLATVATTSAAVSVSAQSDRSDRSDRNELYFGASGGYVSASTDLGSWTEGGWSKPCPM